MMADRKPSAATVKQTKETIAVVCINGEWRVIQRPVSNKVS